MPALHRRAAEWFIQQGQVVDAIRHTQAAGDWPGAARLLADHSFSLTLDGQAQTIQALLRAFPPGADHPELALVRATVDLVQGRLDEAAAHLAVAETYAETAPPDRQRRLRVAIASLKLSLAQAARSPGRRHRTGQIPCLPGNRAVRRGHRARQRPAGGGADESGHRRGVVPGLADAERHLREGAVLARKIGRPYLEVACLAQLGFASKIRPFATTRRRCREAIALADRHGWGAEPIVAPALVTLAANLVWTGEFDEGERWLQRTAQALQTDTGPGIRLLAAHRERHAAGRPRPPP